MTKQLWKNILSFTLLTVITMSVTGCGTSPNSRFYVFPSTYKAKASEVRDLSKTKYNVGILPVTLAPYLDRPQIVTRISKNEIYLDEFNRWGTPLSMGVVSAIAGAIANDLPDAYIDVFPWAGETKFQYQVTIEVALLDGIPGESAYLAAQWTITRGKKLENLVARKTSIFHEKLDSDDYADYVEGLRAVVEQLGNEVARVIQADFDDQSNK